MKNKRIAVVVASLLTFCSLSAIAAEPATESDADTKILGTFGLTFGGDKLATLRYTNGDSSTVHGGGLVLFGVGFDHRFGNGWELQSSINYQVDRANARNGDATFQRFPIDVLGFYRIGNHRFGGGITYHIDPKFSADAPGAHETVNFDNALGGVVEYDYFFGRSLSVGLRGTVIDYKSSDIEGNVNGNYIGLMLNGYFF